MGVLGDFLGGVGDFSEVLMIFWGCSDFFGVGRVLMWGDCEFSGGVGNFFLGVADFFGGICDCSGCVGVGGFCGVLVTFRWVFMIFR